MNNEEKLREIPLKNYIILGVVFVISMFLLYYFYLWVDAYNETKLNRPIMDKYMEVINYNELDNYFVENPDTIIYVSVLENSEIREFEKKLKGLFKNNKIDRKLLYLDITAELKNKKTANELANKYFVGSSSIIDVPLIMVVQNGIVRSILDIKQNNYDADYVLDYINGITFYDEDEING